MFQFVFGASFRVVVAIHFIVSKGGEGIFLAYFTKYYFNLKLQSILFSQIRKIPNYQGILRPRGSSYNPPVSGPPVHSIWMPICAFGSPSNPIPQKNHWILWSPSGNYINCVDSIKLGHLTKFCLLRLLFTSRSLYIMTCVCSVQHPSAGQNIQHI